MQPLKASSRFFLRFSQSFFQALFNALQNFLFRNVLFGVFLRVPFKAVAQITRQTFAHGRGGCQKVSPRTVMTTRGGEGGAGAKDRWCTDVEHDVTLVKATAKKRLPCRTEWRSRQAEDYLNRLRGPKREGAEEETRWQLRRRRGPTTNRYLYVVPLESQWLRLGTSLFVSVDKTHRMPLIFFGRRLEFTGRAATGINSHIGNKICVRETERREEREKEKRGLISRAERNRGPLLFGYIAVHFLGGRDYCEI